MPPKSLYVKMKSRPLSNFCCGVMYMRPGEELKSIGISRIKLLYGRQLSEKVLNNSLFRKWNNLYCNREENVFFCFKSKS